MDMCTAKGFDAIEPGNMDGYSNKTDCSLPYADQLRYNTWLAEKAHEQDLSIAIKNDEAQVQDLLPYYDFAITEDCFDGRWCSKMKPFVQSGKAMLPAEYTDTGGRFCGAGIGADDYFRMRLAASLTFFSGPADPSFLPPLPPLVPLLAAFLTSFSSFPMIAALLLGCRQNVTRITTPLRSG